MFIKVRIEKRKMFDFVELPRPLGRGVNEIKN